jgi:hypothetical protein
MADMIPIIACLKWGKGYPTIYTNTLFRAVKDSLSVPFRFVCITDDADGLDADIEIRDLPYFALDRSDWTKGMWPKFAICAKGMFEPGTVVLYMDVDVMVTGDLAPMIHHISGNGGLHVPQDWHDTHERLFPKLFPSERITHGAVIGFIAGEQDHLYEMVKDRGADLIQEYGNDQVLFHNHGYKRQYLPKGWVLSFKKSLAWHFPTSMVLQPSRPPRDCMIVSFHGQPNPQDLTQGPFKRWGSPEKFGYFPVRWIKDYWTRYSRQTDH